MTENQYIRANRTVLFTVLIVFGYIALTLMAALGVGDGHNKGKILIQFVVALAVIIVSVAAYILRKKTRVCELTIAVSMAFGYVVLILLNSTDGVWTYVLPLIMASMVYLNEKLINERYSRKHRKHSRSHTKTGHYVCRDSRKH